MKLSLSFSVLYLLSSVVAVKNCPLLGRDFPPPMNLNAPIIQNAIARIKSSIETFLSDGTLEEYTSSFSINIFSAHSPNALFTYHHSSSFHNAAEGVSTISDNTVYRIGSISKLFSVYLFLIEAGDRYFNDAVTGFVPELEALKGSGAGVEDMRWNEITLGSLASHLSGIARDYLFDLQSSNATLLLDLGFPPNATAFTAYIDKGICSRRGRNFEEMLEVDLLQKLGLSNTFYSTPNNTNGAIPFNATYSSWNYSLGDLSPAGNMYSSINDMAVFGKSILNSSLLSPAQTRRWMKPLTHTSDPLVSVGAPWEILRYQLPSSSRIVDLYTKDGEIGLCESLFVFQAGLSYNARVIANLISDVLFPALEGARIEAHETYGGTFDSSTPGLNSSITITTDSQKPGLEVSSWISNGTDIIAELTSTFLFNDTDIRLYPTGLKGSGGKESWRAVFGTKQTLGAGIFSQMCTTWGLVDNYRYGGRAIDEFVFMVKEGEAESVDARGFDVVLIKGG